MRRLARRSWIGIAIAAIAAFTLCGVLLVRWLSIELTPDPGRGFRGALPKSARDVLEWHWADGFLPDYSYCMRATMTRAEFERYVATLHLKPHTPSRRYSDPDGYPGWYCSPPWWKAPSADGELWVEQAGEYWTTAAYDGTYLWLSSMTH